MPGSLVGPHALSGAAGDFRLRDSADPTAETNVLAFQ
jgi:hypothetical protein